MRHSYSHFIFFALGAVSIFYIIFSNSKKAMAATMRLVSQMQAAETGSIEAQAPKTTLGRSKVRGEKAFVLMVQMRFSDAASAEVPHAT
jgi:hypothetical protein